MQRTLSSLNDNLLNELELIKAYVQSILRIVVYIYLFITHHPF